MESCTTVTGRGWLSDLHRNGVGLLPGKERGLHQELKDLIDFKSDQRLTYADILQDWWSFHEPGLFIQRLISPVAPEGLHGREKQKAGVATAIKVLEPDAIRAHINMLRRPDFDPREYAEKGYVLRGSIKTDGYRLQLLAFKVRELLSVRYKRPGYRPEVLPDRLVSVTAGTSDPLTEVRNALKSKEDVERRVGCTADQADEVCYFGIDIGQACIVGAYALLPANRKPRIGGRSHNRHRGRKRDGRRNKRGSRGRRRRGGKQTKKKKGHSTDAVRHIELFGKQKAVSQPTLKHRTWMQARKRMPLNQSTNRTAMTVHRRPPTRLKHRWSTPSGRQSAQHRQRRRTNSQSARSRRQFRLCAVQGRVSLSM